MTTHTMSVLVENKHGVLARVSGLFSRRGFNIHSLAVGPTEIPDISRMTIVVNVEDRVKHGLYGKVLRRTSKLKAHDEQNTAGIGDRVQIMETRHTSATKRLRLLTVVDKAK